MNYGDLDAVIMEHYADGPRDVQSWKNFVEAVTEVVEKGGIVLCQLSEWEEAEIVYSRREPFQYQYSLMGWRGKRAGDNELQVSADGCSWMRCTPTGWMAGETKGGLKNLA
jgi:hypothetical protein